MIPRERETVAPIMWRAYQVGLNRQNQLVLAGATGRKWDEVDFKATCFTGADRGIGSAINSRMHQSKVFMPGEMGQRRDPADLSMAHRRCVAHLENNQCSCGIWGYKSPTRVQREYLTSEFWTGRHGYGAQWLQVLCSVRIFGTVLEGEWGYRASNARIEAIFAPANTEMYARRDVHSMKPYFGEQENMSFFTAEPEVGYAAIISQRIDPQVVWAKVSEKYRAQVIHVADGIDMVAALDIDCPDAMLRPLVRD